MVLQSLESSGDTGVGAPCQSMMEENSSVYTRIPWYLPYVTAVGGTQSIDPGAGTTPPVDSATTSLVHGTRKLLSGFSAWLLIY